MVRGCCDVPWEISTHECVIILVPVSLHICQKMPKCWSCIIRQPKNCTTNSSLFLCDEHTSIKRQAKYPSLCFRWWWVFGIGTMETWLYVRKNLLAWSCEESLGHYIGNITNHQPNMIFEGFFSCSCVVTFTINTSWSLLHKWICQSK